MRSQFSKRSAQRITASSVTGMDETYDLRGLNLKDPDQIMPKGESPMTLNSRMYARETDATRVANRTRRGTSALSTPLGQTLDTQNVTTGTGDLAFSTTRIIAQPFNATATGALTRIDLELKKIGVVSGHVIVELCSNNGGVPGGVLAQSAVLANNITTSYQYLSAYLIDAPTVTATTQYWIVVYVQDNGSGEYYIRQTADAGALDLVSVNDQVSWSSLGVSFRFKSYVSTVGGVKGYARRYPSSGANRTIIAHRDKVISVTDAGVNTTILSGLNVNSDYVRFAQIDDKLVSVNGLDGAYWYDGTTYVAMPGVTGVPRNVIAWKNRLFFLTEKTLVRFSELYDFTNYPSVNFFYVPNPKSPDPATAWVIYRDNMVIFTHETKHIVIGSSISSFQRDEAVGTKGAVSQEAVAVDKSHIYFMADDKQIYRWNGVEDELISDKMAPEFAAIQDATTVRLQIYKNQLRVYYAKTPAVDNERMAVFDIPYNQWFLDTGKKITGGIEWTQDDNELIEFSSKCAWVFRGEQGYSDLGKAIDWKYWTPYKAYGSGAAKDRIKRFRPILRTQQADYTMLVGKDIDFANNPDMRQYLVAGGGAKWGAFVWGDGTKWGRTKQIDRPSAMSGRGKHTQYRFERNGVETPVELYGYISQYKSGRPK